MTATAAADASQPERSRLVVISALGLGQILAWGSTYYLLAVLAKPIAEETGWPFAWVIGGLSLALLVGGLISPRVGRGVEALGGRPLLAISAVLFSVGLAGLALAPSLPFYIGSWLVIGLGMGSGLYDTSFATLGRLYGRGARSSITALTLWGGFASTACWPLSAFLVESLGWRGACFVYAGVHFGLTLPLYWFGLPNERRKDISAERPAASATSTADTIPVAMDNPRLCFALLATTLTLGATISTVVSVHLLTILQARDVALAAAVALGALVGPSQVGARIIEMFAARHFHPIWTLVASNVLLAAGLIALWSAVPFLALALVLCGAGLGIKSIARGTLPLALFGASGYAVLMGRLAMPSLIAQAAAPSIGAALLDYYGAGGTLATLSFFALLNVALVAMLGLSARRAIVSVVA